jgi:hypothetical protein
MRSAQHRTGSATIVSGEPAGGEQAANTLQPAGSKSTHNDTRRHSDSRGAMYGIHEHWRGPLRFLFVLVSLIRLVWPIALTWKMAPRRSMMPRKARAVDDVAPEH